MSLLLKSGIKRISELEIDADKDWSVKGITNLMNLAATMQKGDILVRSDNILMKITPGAAGTRLTTMGAGALPEWRVG